MPGNPLPSTGRGLALRRPGVTSPALLPSGFTKKVPGARVNQQVSGGRAQQSQIPHDLIGWVMAGQSLGDERPVSMRVVLPGPGGLLTPSSLWPLCVLLVSWSLLGCLSYVSGLSGPPLIPSHPAIVPAEWGRSAWALGSGGRPAEGLWFPPLARWDEKASPRRNAALRRGGQSTKHLVWHVVSTSETKHPQL